MKTSIRVLAAAIVSLASTLGVAAPNANAPGSHGAFDKMPRQLEVRLALSALPPSLRAKATVYVLDPAKGYVLDHVGSNGESCFVSRTEWRFADYRNDIFDPICYDAVGARNQMQVDFAAAALRARGVSAESMTRQIEAGFRSGKYHAPDRAGIAYMTAPLMRTYMDSKDKDSVMTVSMPHVMYYAPNVTSAEVGALPCPPCAPYPFVLESGPQGYIVQMLGHREKEKILEDEAGLLRRLCSYRKVLCLPLGRHAKS